GRVPDARLEAGGPARADLAHRRAGSTLAQGGIDSGPRARRRDRLAPVNVVGRPIKRLEDPRLLVGRGRYVDDVVRPGIAHAVFVRSVHAHARVISIDARRALACPGVLACVTAADLGSTPPIPIRQGAKPAHAPFLQPPLAGDRVRYVGEPLAAIVANERVGAVDARDLVDVEYDVLPAVVDPNDAG